MLPVGNLTLFRSRRGENRPIQTDWQIAWVTLQAMPYGLLVWWLHLST
jgi:hypothetical protein